ncbi:MAG: hypothetical protein N2Z75_09645 [Meiothermus sp.]|nr:hypothetical protein [Meiothermus sp.]
MRTLAQVGAIEYGILEHSDIGDMARLLGEAFSQREPMAIAIGMLAADIEEHVRILGGKAVLEGLTVVARDEAGDIVGAVLTEDFGTPPPPGMDAAPTSFAPIGALFDTLDDQYRAAHRIVPGSHLHLFMVGVSERCEGAGIAQTMIKLCLANGAKRGYRMAVTEATGRASQHIFRKLGFRELAMELYGEFLYEGQCVFKAVEAHGGAILMERDVDTTDAA